MSFQDATQRLPDPGSDIPLRLVAKYRDARVEQHKLCETCQRVVQESKIIQGNGIELWVPKKKGKMPAWDDHVNESFGHHPTFAHLIDAAFDGCHLCTLFLERFRNRISSVLSPEDKMPALHISGSPLPNREKEDGRHEGSIEFPCREGDVHIAGQKVSLDLRFLKNPLAWTPHDQGNEYDLAASASCLALSSASHASFTMAAQWIENCQELHEQCNVNHSKTLNLPTRLLAIEQGLQGEDLSVKLAKLHGNHRPAETTSYLTLSHCWGSSPAFRLLESNQEQYEKGIDFKALPKTFQDALIVTAGLGFRHLWIDSLCIIQDSPLDWERESSIMGDIYRGSVATIAANRGKNSQAGLFSVRNPLLQMHCRLSDKIGVPDGALQVPPSVEDHLSTRGWVLQERALAPRTIFFYDGHISWECITETANEMDEPSDHPQIKSRFQNMLICIVLEININEPSSTLSKFMDSWVTILQSYCMTDLTRSSDKLVAIHGIVQRIVSGQPLLTNVAGLWKELLPAELLWRLDPDKPSKHKAVSEYRAPSWSWAATDSPVQIQWPNVLWDRLKPDYPIPQKILCWKVTVLDVKVDSRPNGQVRRGAYMKLKGPLKQVQWAEDSDVWQASLLGRDLWTPDNEEPSMTEELWALLVFRHPSVDVGLILQPVPGKMLTFERKGLFEVAQRWHRVFGVNQDTSKLLQYTATLV